jgi:predicted CoA-binding protein
MPTLKESAEQFLQLKKIAIAGVSATSKGVPNIIYDKLKKLGYDVFAVNPKGGVIDGDSCFLQLADIPEQVEGVVIGTNPNATLQVVQDCAELGIRHVWIHKSLDGGSYSEEAEKFCARNGIKLIPAGCPMMYCKPVDFPHKCIKWILNVTGKLPKTVD